MNGNIKDNSIINENIQIILMAQSLSTSPVAFCLNKLHQLSSSLAFLRFSCMSLFLMVKVLFSGSMLQWSFKQVN